MRQNNDAPDAEALLTRIRHGNATDRAEALLRLSALAEREPRSQRDILLECLTLLQEGSLSAEETAPLVPLVLRTWETVYEQAKPREQEGPSTEWMLEDDYLAARDLGSIVLDLMGHLMPEVAVEAALCEALNLPDPRLKLFAGVSLLRRGKPVAPEEIEAVAACNEVRVILWRRLRKLGMGSLMPERWSVPEQLAASDLVRWAAHPLELGTPPEEIELMERFPVEAEDGETLEAYLFRFREYPKPWTPGEGWMAGIAGPFRDGEATASPWSSFDRWDSVSPAEHIEKLWGCHNTCSEM